MIDKEEYDHLVSALMDASMHVVRMGIAEGVHMGPIPSVFETLWEATRPDTTCTKDDITDRLDETTGVFRYIKKCVFYSYLEPNGQAIAGLAVITHPNGDVGVSTYIPDDGVRDHLDEILAAYRDEVDLRDDQGQRLSSLDDFMKKAVTKSVEDEVDEFRKSMDDALDKWGR